MDYYFVESENIDNLKSALGMMIEYCKFLEKETGRSNDSYVDFILDNENIKVKLVKQ